MRALTLLSLIPTSVFALEYPVGQPIIKNGMKFKVSIYNPITMDTEGRPSCNEAPTC